MRGVCKLILILFFVAASNVAWTMGESRMVTDGLVGKPAPDFTLDTLQEKKVDMTQYRAGHDAIIFFWATWCPHCREQIKELNAHAADIAQKGIKILLVDIGEEEGLVRAHAERHQIKMDVFLDRDSSVSETYRIIGVPTFYFVDKKGIIKDVDHALPEHYEELFK